MINTNIIMGFVAMYFVVLPRKRYFVVYFFLITGLISFSIPKIKGTKICMAEPLSFSSLLLTSYTSYI